MLTGFGLADIDGDIDDYGGHVFPFAGAAPGVLTTKKGFSGASKSQKVAAVVIAAAALVAMGAEFPPVAAVVRAAEFPTGSVGLLAYESATPALCQVLTAGALGKGGKRPRTLLKNLPLEYRNTEEKGVVYAVTE